MRPFRDSMSPNHWIIMACFFSNVMDRFSPFGKVEETSTSSTVNLPSQPTWPRFRISSQSLKNIEGFKSWPSTPSMLLGLKSQWEDFLVFFVWEKLWSFPGLPFSLVATSGFLDVLVSESKVGDCEPFTRPADPLLQITVDSPFLCSSQQVVNSVVVVESVFFR